MNRSNLNKEIVVRLFQAANALQTLLDRKLKNQNLTAKQFFMMIIIGSFDENPKLKEVSERFGTSHQNAKQILNKLEKNGYIYFLKDEKDSRITRISFTKHASEFWEGRSEADDMTMNDIFKSINIDDLNIFKESLIKTLHDIETIK